MVLVVGFFTSMVCPSVGSLVLVRGVLESVKGVMRGLVGGGGCAWPWTGLGGFSTSVSSMSALEFFIVFCCICVSSNVGESSYESPAAGFSTSVRSVSTDECVMF